MAIDTVYRHREITSDVFVTGPRFYLAFIGEHAASQAAMKYDLDHHLWSEPHWDRRARKRAMNKARKKARLEHIANG